MSSKITTRKYSLEKTLGFDIILAFVLLLSSYFFLSPVFNINKDVPNEHILSFISSVSPSELSPWKYIAGQLSVNNIKQIQVQYYGQNFNLETDAKAFGEIISLLPFSLKQEYLEKLESLKIFDGMTITVPPNQYEIGIASWYGSYFHGKPTASTEPFDMYELTAAHKLLPLGTIVRVINLENKKSVVVKINDRGPFVGQRAIDLSWAAASSLGIVNKGLATVLIEILN